MAVTLDKKVLDLLNADELLGVNQNFAVQNIQNWSGDRLAIQDILDDETSKNQFETILNRTSPNFDSLSNKDQVDNFGSYSGNLKRDALRSALQEMRAQAAFEEKYAEFYKDSSPLLQDELNRVIGGLGNFKKSAALRQELLTAIQKREKEAYNKARGTADFGQWFSRNTKNTWDATAGNFFAKVNGSAPVRAWQDWRSERDRTSGVRKKALASFGKVLLAASIGAAAIFVASWVIPGLMVWGGASAATVGLSGTLSALGIGATTVAVSLKPIGDMVKDAANLFESKGKLKKWDALNSQEFESDVDRLEAAAILGLTKEDIKKFEKLDENRRQFAENNAAYVKGNKGLKALVTDEPIIIKINGVDRGALRGLLDVETGKVHLSREDSLKYKGMIGLAVDGDDLVMVPTKEAYQSMSYDQIRDMIVSVSSRYGDSGAKVQFHSWNEASPKIYVDLRDFNAHAPSFKEIYNASLADKAGKLLDQQKLDEILIKAYSEGANSEEKLKKIAAKVLAGTVPGLSPEQLNNQFMKQFINKINLYAEDKYGIKRVDNRNANSIVPTALSCMDVASNFIGVTNKVASKTEILQALAKSSDSLSPQSVGAVAAMVSVGIKPEELDKFRGAVSEIKTSLDSKSETFKISDVTKEVLATLKSEMSLSSQNEVINVLNDAFSSSSPSSSVVAQGTSDDEGVITNIWTYQQEQSRA